MLSLRRRERACPSPVVSPAGPFNSSVPFCGPYCAQGIMELRYSGVVPVSCCLLVVFLFLPSFLPSFQRSEVVVRDARRQAVTESDPFATGSPWSLSPPLPLPPLSQARVAVTAIQAVVPGRGGGVLQDLRQLEITCRQGLSPLRLSWHMRCMAG